MWWLTPFILAPVRLRKVDRESRASLGSTKLWISQGYRVRPCLTKASNQPWFPFRLTFSPDLVGGLAVPDCLLC